MEILNYVEKINEKIENASNIFIMGHKYIDLDAISSALGVYKYVTSKNKKASIIINDTSIEKGVKKVLSKVKSNYSIKKSKDVCNLINQDSLLIIVDTNREYLLQDKDFASYFENIIVIDHHDTTEQSMKKGLIIIDRDASSACEMITDLLENEHVNVDKDLATFLLSGIVIDTNNYVVKTTSNTYKTSYILTTWGANPIDVQYLLKQDVKEYVARQKVITNVKQINNVALTRGITNIKYRREDLAKIVDTLLQFDKIEASFVVGVLDNGNIGISARSLGNINVGQILEKFNGGGDEHEAGASIENTSIKRVEKELKNIIKALK